MAKWLDKDGMSYLWGKIKSNFASKSDAIKNITRSGTTFTATRADNTTFTFTQQDYTESVPIGTVLDFAGNTAPNGYLECNGAAVSRTTYAALYAAIGTTWGVGDGSTTFNLPDLRCRTTLGAGSNGANSTDSWGAYADSTNNFSLGERGGQSKHTLATAELPAHAHTVPKHGHGHTNPTVKMINHVHSNTHGHTQNAHNHGVVITGSNQVAGSGFQYIYSSSKTMQNYYGANDMVKNATPTINNYTGNTGNPTSLGNLTVSGGGVTDKDAFNTNNTGSDTAFAIMQPYAAVKKIIRAL